MLTKVDLSDIADELTRLGDEIHRAAEDAPPPTDDEPVPEVLLRGLTQLIDILRASDDGEHPDATATALYTATGATPEALLDHGMVLLAGLSTTAARLGLPDTARAFAELTAPLACWLIRRGSDLMQPRLVVAALVSLADRLRHPDELARLFVLMSEIAEGFTPELSQGMEPNDPWRTLITQRAIVATRSQQPALMQSAYDTLVEQLPGEAPQLFREWMGQLQTLEYPAPAREIIQRYFDRWCDSQRLH
ncbi:MAG: hypothetical protein EOM91_06005 [Sphingobacteriia bacterium]|nr:hypothetical protein [Sphingobacteriia bacterium]NCC37899.1 hypothetical protein [Gammaproteobacteria bacterium]